MIPVSRRLLGESQRLQNHCRMTGISLVPVAVLVVVLVVAKTKNNVLLPSENRLRMRNKGLPRMA